MCALRPWFALKSVPGVGNLLFRRLVEQFGSPEAAFEADRLRCWRSGRHRPSGQRHHDGTGTRMRVTGNWKRSGETATPSSPRRTAVSPALLCQIPDPPPFLYVYGSLPTTGLNIAVVGSRNATDYGMSTTRQLCMDLARQQVNIVSGMARGVDTAAHSGAIDGGGLHGFRLGHGSEPDLSQERTRNCFTKIAENGAVVTEFSLDTGPDAHHFPARNRIISGMCHGTVVVEATGRSGSLITARLAAEQNREVFAVPGNIHSFKSVGTHALIKAGRQAGGACRGCDWMNFSIFKPNHQRRHPHHRNRQCPPLTDDEGMVIDSLEAESVHIDDLARKLTLPSGRLSGMLLQLELKGLVAQSPGKRFCPDPGVDSQPEGPRKRQPL
jgi:DNA processing protein